MAAQALEKAASTIGGERPTAACDVTREEGHARLARAEFFRRELSNHIRCVAVRPFEECLSSAGAKSALRAV